MSATPSFDRSPRERFGALADDACAALAPGEDLILYLQGEDSDFVRFNRGRIRQPGHVQQEELSVRLLHGARHASIDLSLSGDPAADSAAARAAIHTLRQRLPELPDDPHLAWETRSDSVVVEDEAVALDGPAITRAVVDAAAGVDFVGIQVDGPVWAGLATSRGQRSWHQRSSWLLDWCLYHQGDKAVKRTLGGTAWDPDAFAASMADARHRLVALGRPIVKVSPGRHRAWLSASAMGELMDLLSWSAFGLRATRNRNTPLQPVLDGRQALDPRVSLAEDVAGGLSPGFSPDGFHRPDRVALVEGGQVVGQLVSARSAAEYDVPGTGAASGEAADSLAMAPGGLPGRRALAELGTGLYVSDLWYLNYSDLPGGRITGMTRFATMWVEDGEIVGPAEVMRFDETVGHLLGAGLLELEDTAHLLPSASTYERRSTSSMRLPGALVEGMRFTL